MELWNFGWNQTYESSNNRTLSLSEYFTSLSYYDNFVFWLLKKSLIFESQSYNAKLSDFGLAKHGPTAEYSHVTTQVMGTLGYAALEYVATGHLYVESDVYGFGVVLLEMLIGLRALDMNRPPGQQDLVEWIKPWLYDRRKLNKVIDSKLEGRYHKGSASQIAQLALTCIESEPKNRPSSREVVETLERIQDSFIDKPRQPRVQFRNQLALTCIVLET